MLAGLDTVGFSFPIEPDFDTRGCTVSIAGYQTEGESVRYRRQLPGGGFLGTGIGSSAWVEASLPKRVGDDNVDGLGVVDAMDVIRDLWVEACTFVKPTSRVVVERGVSPRAGGSWDRDGRVWDQASVKRLDIARDFNGVHQMTPLLDGLAGVPRSTTAKVRRFADAASNKAETLRVGPKSAWSGTLYDKHAETRGLCAPGRLRFEARCRSEFLAGHVRDH